jgi:hypothetical protein
MDRSPEFKPMKYAAFNFALDRDTIYVLVDGKERKLHVDRIALKPSEPQKP